MSTDYDAVAKEYKRSKLAPWRTYIERYSLLKLLGKVRGEVGSRPRLWGKASTRVSSESGALPE